MATHGFQDDNVKMDQLGPWWEALKANNVPRKLWLLRAGHEDPFESQRANWVTTLHRWFDRWLYGVNNGIENEPKVHIEDKIDQWGDYAEWPVPGTQNVDLFLRAEGNLAGAGSLASVTGGSADSLSFSAANQSEANLMNNPTGSQATRRVFMSQGADKGRPHLRHADRGSDGAVRHGLQRDQRRRLGRLPGAVVPQLPGAQRRDRGVLRHARRRRSADPVHGDLAHQRRRHARHHALTAGATARRATSARARRSARVHFADAATAAQIENACYLDPVKPTTSVTSWRVTHGTLDVENRDSKFFQQAALTPVTITDKYRLRFPTMSIEHTFKAGSQIAVIVGGYNTSRVSSTGRPNNVPVTLDTRASKVTLPIVGG